MIIESMTHRYDVICLEDENEKYEIYRCRELDETEQQYMVYGVKDTVMIKALAGAFTSEGQYENFDEYYECFSVCGKLFLVFYYYGSGTIAAKLESEDCSLSERFAIGKNLLQRLLILDMPDFLMSEVISPDRILADASISIHFRYRLDGILLTEEQRTEKICNGLAEIFTALFKNELALEKCEEILAFIERISTLYTDNGTNGLIQIYHEYENLEDMIPGISGNGHIRPNTFCFRMWDRIKSAYPVVKKIVFGLIVVVLAGYLVYDILFPSYSKECIKFNSIGTLSIIEPSTDVESSIEESMETMQQ